MSKCNTIIGLIIIFVIILSAITAFIYKKYPKYSKDKEYVREYVIGDVGIKGSVNVTQFGDDSAYEIGADKDGYAVFKNPNKAFEQMKTDYAKGIAAIKEEYKPGKLSRWNFRIYQQYGCQLTKTEDTETVNQGFRVSQILDIYENSFN